MLTDKEPNKYLLNQQEEDENEREMRERRRKLERTEKDGKIQIILKELWGKKFFLKFRILWYHYNYFI